MTSSPKMEAIWARIPYEVFLLIVEAAVDDAYSQACRTRCTLYLDTTTLEESPLQKRVFVSTDDGEITFKKRFSLVKHISHINHSARRAVHRRFVRLPRFDYSPSVLNIAAPEGWVCPAVDAFAVENHRFPLGIFKDPTPEIQEIARNVRIVNLMLFSTEYFGEALALLEALPRVEVATLYDHLRWLPMPMAFMWARTGDVLQPRDPSETDGDIEMLCRPIWDMGIRFHIRYQCGLNDTENDDLEVISTPEGVRIKVLGPEINFLE
ncbi:hypothetical protein CPLU01_08221 [Colletotrichum plurivorum]|uniref:Uncharacterized protein n=1 Tax=Colletotrichum plurivorum TaxID=2175906 RepID=A0A8H6KCM9_9PEZI|nr:hypothetical protein CPLU01_08221 [Colletotrichum plurivorum]